MVEVTVIVPVGPGHKILAEQAANSVTIKNGEVLLIDDLQGKFGRSRARNEGVKKAKYDWIFFLDADDVMHPKAFQYAKKYFKDYVGIWGLITEESGIRPQVRSLEYRELLTIDPFRTLQMGHFVKTEIALKYPFNEQMDCGEDFFYYLEVWKNEKCIKIQKTLFINRRGRHSTGQRSADGQMWRKSVEKVINEHR